MKKFPVSDGTIEKITCNRNTLLMEFTDWQEQSWIISFQDLIAFQGIGAVGSEISEMYEASETSLSGEAMRVNSNETGKNYCFTSSRGGEVIFIVVAGDYDAEKI
ncbi:MULTISPECIES: hypothetical protein [unclassified Pseudomonas]|uniref:hypothetical protein n=1 Tax=unclassified Pseudomonas TaxID=196821 RepID=UPI0011ECBEE5|nr:MULTISPECIES: hypothetical protein [unclassified Pseudomonas]KAA0944620.1 hypothetical protein FQ182_20675 [Pseudomonas sp. ANT_H4]KAA0951254.1 hypothetical protein FQ186_16900 [Pseudomonas sp. ANT_H14]